MGWVYTTIWGVVIYYSVRLGIVQKCYDSLLLLWIRSRVLPSESSIKVHDSIDPVPIILQYYYRFLA